MTSIEASSSSSPSATVTTTPETPNAPNLQPPIITSTSPPSTAESPSVATAATESSSSSSSRRRDLNANSTIDDSESLGNPLGSRRQQQQPLGGKEASDDDNDATDEVGNDAASHINTESSSTTATTSTTTPQKHPNAPRSRSSTFQIPKPLILPCASCHKPNKWSDEKDYHHGLPYQCAYCDERFQRVECPFCCSALMWKVQQKQQQHQGGNRGKGGTGTNNNNRLKKGASSKKNNSAESQKKESIPRTFGFIEGQIYRCPNRVQCGKAFQIVSCPSCVDMVNFQGLDFIEGRRTKCPKCDVWFQKVTCPHCCIALHWIEKKEKLSNNDGKKEAKGGHSSENDEASTHSEDEDAQNEEKQDRSFNSSIFDQTQIYNCCHCHKQFQKIACSECNRLNDFVPEKRGEGAYDGKPFVCVHCGDKSQSLAHQLGIMEK